MHPFRRLSAAAAVACLALAAPALAPAAQAQFSDTQRGEIERIIKDYLLRNPEVLQEAIGELEKKQAAAEAEKHKAAVKANAKLLFNSTRQVTIGNPQGDVTMVEFFDYNCGYCKRALTDMMELMKADPKLKVVLKEFPVLGPASVEAAQVATAVRMQDRTGKKYLEFHQKLLTGRGQVDKAKSLAAAKEVGLDMARLEKDMASDEVRASLAEAMELAEKLGLNGTPSYVIGPDVVVGAVGLNALKEKVEAARACAAKATC
jgi:protein-disulfide isomerase